ncbi:MAG: alginate lyase family protein [Tunicatimonas sp.]|uniref:alginate lyase family protein n=1 Tax=Tunicatimonas sp. TaxID=1940096 RepID=UPI003C75D0CA
MITYRLHCLLTLLSLVFQVNGIAQTTNTVLLDSAEIDRLRQQIATHGEVQQLYDSVVDLAELYRTAVPRPLSVLYYEGLLENNPDRIDTRKSLADIDKLISYIYASYGQGGQHYAAQVKRFVLAWSGTYQPTGNTIDENKFCPLFWSYYLFRDYFSSGEQQQVEAWMRTIARKQMERKRTPNNNWQAKRMKIAGIVGCVTNDEEMKQFSLNGLKEYINTAYYADSTSRDLAQRDALHYHVGGLKPLLSIFINLKKFDPAFDLFSYTSPDGASVEKSVAYVVPYATGQKVRQEWVNSKVELDHQRAAAGLEEYQPGILFDPAEAIPLFEWASYYHRAWYSIVHKGSKGYTATWVGLLNSPLVRTK